jgi:Uncharacterized conserved protein
MFDFAKRSSTVLIITGVAAVIFGIFAVAWPLPTVLTLVLIWGWYALIDGALELVAAFRPENRPARILLILTGAIGVLAGLFVIFRPFESGVILAWILGIWLIIRGATELFSAFSRVAVAPRWMLALAGVLFIVAGIIFISNPGTAALALSKVLGVLAIFWGVFILGGGIALRSELKKAKEAVESN